MSFVKRNEDSERNQTAKPYMHKRVNSINSNGGYPKTYMLSEYTYDSPEYN